MRRFTATATNRNVFSEVEVGQTFRVGNTIFMRLDSNFNEKAGIANGSFNAIRLTKRTDNYKTRLFAFGPEAEVFDINTFVMAHESRVRLLNDSDDDS